MENFITASCQAYRKATFASIIVSVVKASVHDGTKVPATCNWTQKLSRNFQIKGDI